MLMNLSNIQLYKQNKPQRKFMSSLQNEGWRYWSHFQAIQPNARAKGQRALQPSHHDVVPGGDGDDTKTPQSTQAPTPTTAGPMSTSSSLTNDSAAALRTTSEKRSSDVMSIDSNSDSDPTSLYGNVAPSTTMVGSAGTPKSKDVALAPPNKAPKRSASSTARSSSAASGVSGSTKPPSSSIVSKSEQSSSSVGLSRNMKAQTFKDLGNALSAMKDSLMTVPEDPVSRLRRESTAFVMKDTRISYESRMHIAVLIQDDIKFAESLMGMVEADVDNDGAETGAVVMYYKHLTKHIQDD